MGENQAVHTRFIQLPHAMLKGVTPLPTVTASRSVLHMVKNRNPSGSFVRATSLTNSS